MQIFLSRISKAQNIDLKHVVTDYKNYIAPLQEEYAKYNKLYEEKSSIFDINNAVNRICSFHNKVNHVRVFDFFIYKIIIECDTHDPCFITDFLNGDRMKWHLAD